MEVQKTEITTDRTFTVPNLLSMARLLGVPLFLWLILVPEADGWADSAAERRAAKMAWQARLKAACAAVGLARPDVHRPSVHPIGSRSASSVVSLLPTILSDRCR